MLCKHEVVGSIPSGSTSRSLSDESNYLVHENTYSHMIEASIVCVLSDIVKRGSYRACEHEKSCACVHVLPQQLAAADILLRRWSVLFRKRLHLVA